LALRDTSALLDRHARHLSGSLIGGITETQELLDFGAEHHVIAEIEEIPIQEIEKAYEGMLKSDVKYRFVIRHGFPYVSDLNKSIGQLGVP
jgi:D-arabinose 1-dehydrogenase-like Zn-dependent alcohol dehydrogenase